MNPFKPEDFLILVVDDLSKNIQLLIEILDKVGYLTTFALSGQQALERVKIATPDLILLDLMMPEMNGIEVCQKLKSAPETETIPIIFLTANNDKDNLLNAFETGAVDYITKPFKAPELLARVKTHLELKKAQEQLLKAYEEMKKLANTDSLTGIANRRFLFEFAQQELQRSQRYQNPLSLLMIDIDHFKKINDIYGHDIGDEAIKMTVDTINQCLRHVDCLGRFGGEEFVVILPETAIKGAFQAAERIRQAIAAQPLTLGTEMITITVSIGVATHQPDETTIDPLIQRADFSLYQAKAQGRNQVFAWTDEPLDP